MLFQLLLNVPQVVHLFALRLGVTQSFVSKCERGERRLDIVEVRAWGVALGIPFTEFISSFDLSCNSYAI